MIFGEYNLFNILFLNLDSTTQNGGAISFSISASMFFKLSFCTFLNCRSSSGFGGAIWFNCTNNGGINFNKICANYCYCGNTHFLFAFISCSDISNNFFEYVSITKCYIVKSQYHYPLRMDRNNIEIKSINESFNICHWVSGLLIIGKNISSFIKYSSFISNDSSYINIYISTFLSFNLSFCNIIKNNSPNGHSVIFANDKTNLNIFNCIFKQNLNILFSHLISSMKIINCYYDILSTSGISIILFNNFNLITNTYLLNHFQTISCPAENPLIFEFSFNNNLNLSKFIFLLNLIFFL